MANPAEVGTAIQRMKACWPAQRWEPVFEREYRSALAEQDAGAVERAVTRAIRGWGGKFAPPIAALVEVIRDERHQAEAEERRKAAQRQADRERSGAAPVWHGYLWVAALWHSLSSRGLAVPPAPKLAPYLEVCRRLDLRPEHGVRGHREHRELKVKQALRLAEEIFIASGEEDTEEARRAAVELIIGRVRREDA